MSYEQEIEALEISIKDAKEKIALGDALDKLAKNTAFKKVIIDGYFVNEASRLVLTKASPNASSEEVQREIDNAIIGIGQLRQYFYFIQQQKQMALKALEEDENTLSTVLQEDGEA